MNHPNKGWRLKGPFIGSRVQVPAHSDIWMRGARFGAIVGTKYNGGLLIVRVKMDHPQVKRLQVFALNECSRVA